MNKIFSLILACFLGSTIRAMDVENQSVITIDDEPQLFFGSVAKAKEERLFAQKLARVTRAYKKQVAKNAQAFRDQNAENVRNSQQEDAQSTRSQTGKKSWCGEVVSSFCSVVKGLGCKASTDADVRVSAYKDEPRKQLLSQ
jgi:hypothetical protein